MVKNNDRRFGILSWSPYSQPKESEEEKENSRKQPKRTESDSLLNPPKMTRFGSDSKLPKPEEGREKTQEDRPKSGHVRFQVSYISERYRIFIDKKGSQQRWL